MKIAIMGAGAIGGFFGAKLVNCGYDVKFIARGKHLDAIQRDGLHVVTNDTKLQIDCLATDNPNEVGAVDLVLFTVKSYHNEAALSKMEPLVCPSTVIMSLQNGIDTHQSISHKFGQDKMMPGIAYIEAQVEHPGVIKQRGDIVYIEFGELDGKISTRTNDIQTLLTEANIKTIVSHSIQQALWKKMVFVATLAGITCIAKKRIKELMTQSTWRSIIIGCMHEIVEVARANGMHLHDDVVPSILSYMENSLEDLQASMHTDLIAGRPLELDALTGAIVKAGQVFNEPTPINNLIYALLEPYKLGKDK